VLDLGSKVSAATDEMAVFHGFAHLLNGEPEKALEVVRDPGAIERNPDLSRIIAGLAYLAMDQREKAFDVLETLDAHTQEELRFYIEFVRRQEGLTPEDLTAFGRMALLAYRGWWPLVKKEAEAITERSGDTAFTLYWRAEAARNMGDWKGAEALYQQLVEKAPYSGRGWVALATIRSATDKAEALSYYQKALPHFAGDDHWLTRLHSSMGVLNQELGRNDEAIREYMLALEHDPEFWQAANNLAGLIMEKDPDRARELAETAVKSAPGLGSVRDTLGWIYLQEGNVEKALEELQAAVRLDPYQPSIRYHSARAYQAAGDISRAKNDLRMALSIGVDFPEKEEAENLLKELDSQAKG